MSDQNQFCQIDHSGVLFDQNGLRIVDEESINIFFNELKMDSSFQLRSMLNKNCVIVEAFDEPIIANEIYLSESGCEITNSYNKDWPFDLKDLSLDEWDRFHGITSSGIPFVLNNEAQDEFFDQLDEFDDDSITYKGKVISIPPYWSDEVEVESADYWSEKYKSSESRWDLGEPAAGLLSLLPKLKMPTSRVLVLGGGGGHDAAYLASLGHVVTLVDISPEAIAQAKKSYSTVKNLNFMTADLFDLPSEMYNQYDLVFEHTCFCAINPSLREPLIRQWRRLLTETGFLFGVFFVMSKRSGPPFGASEWELKERFKKCFQPMIWQRFRNSIEPRAGRELLVYAQKIPSL